MEVHHHPQIENIAPGHAGKRFKEYLLEFLMIFLAVTLGFFAETIREKITEHRRAVEFADSMVKDLTEDTIQLRHYRDYFNIAACNIDTLEQLLGDANPSDISSGKLYWYGLFGGARSIFVPNDETFQQMKSSGSLRFFGRNAAVAVAKYDRFCRQLQFTEQAQLNIYTEIRKIRGQIFNVKYNDAANTVAQRDYISPDYQAIDSFVKTNPPLLTTDKILFNQYLELVRSRFIRTSILRYADSLLSQASIVIKVLNKEYQ